MNLSDYRSEILISENLTCSIESSQRKVHSNRKKFWNPKLDDDHWPGYWLPNIGCQVVSDWGTDELRGTP